MRLIPKKIFTYTGVAALSTAGLFAATAGTMGVRNTSMNQPGFVNEIETVLGLNASQQQQARSAIQQAKQQATPIEQQLKETNSQMESAIHSGNTAEIQQLSRTQGREIGRLLQARDMAVARVYQTLTPQQKTRANALHDLLMTRFQQRIEHAGSRTGSEG